MSGNHYAFVCPACGKGSASDADAEDGYCGACRTQTAIPVKLSVGPVEGIIGHLSLDPAEPVASKLASLFQGCYFEFSWLQLADDYYRQKGTP